MGIRIARNAFIFDASADRLLIEKGSHNAADRAYIHDTGDSQVQVSGFLRHDLAGTSE